MVEFLGWVGFLLLLATLLPFVLRRLPLKGQDTSFWVKSHHSLALACVAVLSFHGLWALTGRRGLRWGARANLEGDIITGILTLALLVAVYFLAAAAARKKTFRRTHCGLVGLLILLVFLHVF